MSRITLAIGVFLGLILSAVLTGVLIGRKYQFNGSIIEPLYQAPDFTLMDQYGEEFNLANQTGKVNLIFFGYTSCPDVCPVTLSEFGKIYNGLGDDREGVNLLFITVDPERDIGDRLKKYLENFTSPILGLTGDTSVLEEVWQDYGVLRIKQGGSNSDEENYLVDHTARLYAIDKNGNLRITYPYGFPVEGIIEDVRYLLEE